MTMDDLLIIGHRVRIVDLAMRRRLPVMGEFKPLASAGALMSYSPDQIDMWRRAAGYVDKIFKGGQARRPSRGAADQVRADCKPQEPVVPRSHRRGH